MPTEPPGPAIARRTFVAGAAALAALPALAQTPTQETEMPLQLVHLNPENMHQNPAFSQGIIIPPGLRTLLIGGQNAVNEKGEVDIAQTRRCAAHQG